MAGIADAIISKSIDRIIERCNYADIKQRRIVTVKTNFFASVYVFVNFTGRNLLKKSTPYSGVLRVSFNIYIYMRR
jgi:hypothetical protein